MVFVRYLRVIGLVILLSVTWLLIILTLFGRKKNITSEIMSTASLGVFSMLKFFMYINFVRVALGDEKSSLKETYEFAKKDVYQMLRVWFGSGLLLGAIFILCIVILLILNKVGIIHNTQQNIIAPAILAFLLLILVFKAFAEQIGIFNIYLKDRINVNIIG